MHLVGLARVFSSPLFGQVARFNTPVGLTVHGRPIGSARRRTYIVKQENRLASLGRDSFDDSKDANVRGVGNEYRFVLHDVRAGRMLALGRRPLLNWISVAQAKIQRRVRKKVSRWGRPKQTLPPFAVAVADFEGTRQPLQVRRGSPLGQALP